MTNVYKKYDYEGYPQPIADFDDNTEGALCHCSCSSPFTKALPIKRKPGKNVYRFHCLGCGLEGELFTSGGGISAFRGDL